MLLGMITIIIIWALMIPITAGIGLLLPKPYRTDQLSAGTLVTDFWLGLAVAIAILQLWQLLLPADSMALILLVALGLMGILIRFKAVYSYVSKRKRKALVVVLLYIFLSLPLANRALDALAVYDAGLYHLGMIEWLGTYRLIPGLGNLHGRFAFNNASFLLYSPLEFDGSRIRSYHLITGSLLLVASMQIGLSAWRILYNRSACRLCDSLSTLFLAPVVFYALTATNSTSPDLVVFLFGFVIGIELCRLLFERSDSSSDYRHVAVICLLAAAGIAVKLSFIALGSLSALIAIGIVVYRLTKSGQRVSLQYAAWIIAPALILLLTWTVRGYVLSGYPGYPSTIGGIETVWSVPLETARREMIVTLAWARQERVPPEVVLADWAWLRPWSIVKISRAVTIKEVDLLFPLLLIGLAAVVVMASRKMNHGRERNDGFRLVLYLIPPLAATLFWFFTTPTTRFLGASLWIAAGMLFVYFLEETSLGKQNGVMIVAALLTGIAIGAPMSRDSFPVLPGPDHGLYPLTAADVQEFETDSGLIVYVPVEGDQCWGAPLPCTPYPNASLRFVDADAITSGFSVRP